MKLLCEIRRAIHGRRQLVAHSKSLPHPAWLKLEEFPFGAAQLNTLNWIFNLEKQVRDLMGYVGIRYGG